MLILMMTSPVISVVTTHSIDVIACVITLTTTDLMFTFYLSVPSSTPADDVGSTPPLTSFVDNSNATIVCVSGKFKTCEQDYFHCV